MIVEVEMPDVGQETGGGKIVKWHTREGDAVSKGEVLAEVETDKSVFAVEAHGDGELARIIVDEGAAIRALERLEAEGVKETKIIVGKGGPGPAGPAGPSGGSGSVPQLLKKQTPQRSKSISKPPATDKPGN